MAADLRLADEAKTTTQDSAEFALAVLPNPAELARIVEEAAESREWIGRVRLRAEQRWYERIHCGPDYDLWVISWMPGQSTGFHDHGASSGAFVVVAGELEELGVDGRTYLAATGQPRCFGPDYAHDVRNVSNAPAVSIHAYSPPLTEMKKYELDGGRLIPREGTRRLDDEGNQSSGVRAKQLEDRIAESRIEEVLTAARARLRRMTPEEALEAVVSADAVLVDIRPASQRAIEGSIPGALVIERNVLEWRFDPTSSARLPIVNGPDLQVIVLCSQGYASSLAAADLQGIGLWRATDIIGGFQAWRTTGLPTEPPSETCES